MQAASAQEAASIHARPSATCIAHRVRQTRAVDCLRFCVFQSLSTGAASHSHSMHVFSSDSSSELCSAAAACTGPPSVPLGCCGAPAFGVLLAVCNDGTDSLGLRRNSSNRSACTRDICVMGLACITDHTNAVNVSKRKAACCICLPRVDKMAPPVTTSAV